MPRGGYRPGSGRKPSGLTTKTREIAERAIAEGETPLEVMLNNMCFYHRKAREVLAKLIADGALLLEVAEGAQAGERHANVIEAISQVLELRKRAGEEAARAAPYVHPRGGYAARDNSNDEKMPPLAERLAYYQRQDDLKAAGGTVVERKRLCDQGVKPGGPDLNPRLIGE